MSSAQLIEGEDALRTVIAKSPSNKLVVVEFFAEWCQACTQLGPIFDRLSEAYKNSATFLKIDIDYSPSIAETYRISRLPTIVFLQGGQEVDRTGSSASDLEAKLTRWTSKSFSSSAPGLTAVNEDVFQGTGNRLGDQKTEKQGQQPGDGENGCQSSTGNRNGWFSSLTNWFSYEKKDKAREILVLAQEKMGVDLKLPHAPIQIRLVDSTKLRLLLNLHQPVSKIREFIIRTRPEFASKQFLLLSSFPRKEITDETVSIGDAELGHAVVIQKLAKL